MDGADEFEDPLEGSPGSGEPGKSDDEDADGSLFQEIQQPPWPLMALGFGSSAAGVIAAARALTLVARFGVAALAVGGLGLVFRELLFPLTVSLFPDELHIRFGRRTRFRIPLKHVVQAYARTYDPMTEYGGWGIRGAKGNRAFNMRGNRGVQLVLRSGQKVLIGSERPEELAEAIRSAADCEGYATP